MDLLPQEARSWLSEMETNMRNAVSFYISFVRGMIFCEKISASKHINMDTQIFFPFEQNVHNLLSVHIGICNY